MTPPSPPWGKGLCKDLLSDALQANHHREGGTNVALVLELMLREAQAFLGRIRSPMPPFLARLSPRMCATAFRHTNQHTACRGPSPAEVCGAPCLPWLR